MTPSFEILIPGFAARSSRGFLGWSTVTLLRTAHGVALFDTGGAGDRVSLLKALAAHGLASGDINTVVLSHLHFDHVANVECFPDAEIVLHETEVAHLQKGDDLAIPQQQARSILRGPRLTIVSGELDVLPGVRMIRTPGHTAGHISLVMQVAGRCVVLAQDAIKHRGEVLSGISAGAIDPAAAAASISRIVSMADVIVPGHDAVLHMQEGRVAQADASHLTIDLTCADNSVRIEY